MSHLTQSMVEQFFELEKESARGVLRKEMDTAMDTIFKQMKRKLMMLVEGGPGADETGHGLGDLGDTTDREQQHSNDTNNTPFTSTNSRTPDNSNQDAEIIVKNELGEIVNIIPNESILPSSTQPSNDNDNDEDLFDELDDEDLFDELDDEDCDCSECVDDLFIIKEEVDDQVGDVPDNDNSQSFEDLIDESNDSSSRPTKRPRLENDQVHDQAQPNNQANSNQYITISLKCSQCSQMFQDKDALNAHLKSVHSIELYRCLYKDCNRSFDKPKQLSHHHQTTHPNHRNSIWPCGYCFRHFKNRNSLFCHHLLYHQEGVFQCAHADCQFVGELKQTVINHVSNNHRELVCQHPGCTKRFPNASQLKNHERTHLDVKPYRCKWPKCQYDSASKSGVIKHIRKHLKKVEKQKRRSNISNDPNDYFELVGEL